MAADASAPPLARWPWWLALAGVALDLVAFWPGLLSFDSAQAWWQARHRAATGITPLPFVLLWQAADRLGAGPGALFVLQLTLFWSGLALLAQALQWPARRGAPLLLAIALLPVPWLLRGHVWTDVIVLAAACCALGLLARAQRSTRPWPWLLLALPCLACAGLLRHNALPAMLPLAWWWSTLARPARGTVRGACLARAALACALLLAIFGLGRLLQDGIRERVPVWPSLAQFDLAGMSVRSGQMLLPAFMVGPGLEVGELAHAFRPWSNLTLFDTRHGVRSPFEPPLSPLELATLRRAWLDAIATHPAAWLGHRWQVTRALLGTHAADWPAELIYVQASVDYRDNPPIATHQGALHARLMQLAALLRATPLLAAWPCLLAGLLAALPAWRRRTTLAGRVALTALASAALLALPLGVLAPAAELRYLGWPCVASLIALAAVLATPRQGAR